MRVTVAICTWNRAKLLDQTLTQMRKLRIPEGVDWELLVVNNNSSDDTEKVLLQHKDFLPLRSLFEKEQGTSYARNRAVLEARGELLLWTDDDVLVHPDWLAEYCKAAAAWPKASYFGGTIEPWYETQPPAWVQRHLDAMMMAFAVRQYGNVNRLLEPHESLNTANMAIWTNVARRYPFEGRLGPIGKCVAGIEDHDLIVRLQADAHQGVWIATARVRHFIPKERMTLDYTWAWRSSHGKRFARHNPLPPSKTLWGRPRWLLRQYWMERMKMWCFAPFRSKRWLSAFLKAAYLHGILEELRNPLAATK